MVWEKTTEKSWIQKHGKGLDELFVSKFPDKKGKWVLWYKMSGSYHAQVGKYDTEQDAIDRALLFISHGGK